MRTLSTLLAVTVLFASTLPAAALAQARSEADIAKDEIWALEQSIYAGRAKGDMSNYVNNTSPDYLSWPPTSEKPMGFDVLSASAKKVTTSKEKLTMEFTGFALHGDTAVIYYRTHRTMRADGTPSDDRFHTTHTWVRDNGKWKVFGGMARPMQMKP